MFVGITRAQQELAAQPGRVPRLPRPAQADDPQFVPDGIAARRDGRPAAGSGRGSSRSTTCRVDHEPVYRHDEPQEPTPLGGAGLKPAIAAETAAPRRLGIRSKRPRLQTAAEMLRQSDSRPAIDPDAFRQGMVVLHSEFGLGKVVALGGSGGERLQQLISPLVLDERRCRSRAEH